MELNTRCSSIQSNAYDHLYQPIPKTISHLEDCPSCNHLFQHFSEIRTSLKNLPKIEFDPTPTEDSLKARWLRLPWYLKSAAELFSLALVILGVIVIFPKIQSYYERQIDTRLEDFRKADWNAADLNELPEFDEEYLKDLSPSTDHNFTSTQGESEIEGLSKYTGSGESIKVGESEIWRFNILSENPRELRPQIVKMIQTKITNAPQTEGFLGILVPGGIQFDFIAPKEAVTEIKSSLEQIRNQPSAIDEKLTGARQPFTWYKKKSPKKDIPPGFSRIVIWISQI